MKDYYEKIKGFTLAEVLITLSILGVVAALTVPSIHRKWQDAYTISAVRQAYSILDNAFRIMYLEQGDSRSWDIPSNLSGSNLNEWIVKNKLLPYLKVQKYCGHDYGCMPGQHDSGIIWSNTYAAYRTLNNKKGEWCDTNGGGYNNGKMVLANGMALAFNNFTITANHRGATVRVDINGKKGPNRYGYDVFFFVAGVKGVVLENKCSSEGPYGCYYNNPKYCKIGSTDEYNSCANWIIKHGNLDYRKRDVSSEW